MPEKGSPVKMLLRFNGKMNTQYVSYDIYKVKSEGHEIYQSTMQQGLQSDWSWIWKGIYFNDEGTYKIYVYTAEDNLITSSQVKIDFAAAK